MERAEFIDLLFLLLTAVFFIITTLIGIIFSWLRRRLEKNEDDIDAKINGLAVRIEDRLRTLGHEDRDIRSQINGLTKLYMQTISNREKID